jgi:hypothetical protein
VNTSELFSLIIKKLKRFSILIIVFAVACALVLFYYAKKTPATYTSKASVFPLTSSNETVNTSSAITQLLLGTEGGKSFTEDASINIVELAQSRSTREAVASIQVPSMGNKTIAELLINDYNDHRGLFEDKIQMPSQPDQMIVVAGGLLRDGLNASVNKNSTLILAYSGRSQDLVKTISYGFIEKISKFYIDLKREKAKTDYDFATNKADSLKNVMNGKDNQLVGIDRTTMFTPNRLEYKLPTENVLTEKQMIRNQYAQAVSNQQNAAYKLQKETPIVKVLDKPDPPYDVEKKSSVTYAMIGGIIGVFLICILLCLNIFVQYIQIETKKLLTSGSISEESSREQVKVKVINN